MRRIFHFLGLIVFLFFSCKEKPSTTLTDREETVTSGVNITVNQVAKLQQRISQKQPVSSGSAEPMSTVDIGFNIPGRVSNVYVKEGQLVRTGQLLALQEIGSIKYSLQAANATLAQAQDAYDRATIMNERGSLAPIDYQKAIASLEQAKASQSQSAHNIKDTRLLSTVTGIIAKRNIEPGEQAGPGMPQFSIVKIHPIKVVTNIPEAELGHYKTGQETKINIPALDTNFTGKVTQIGVIADPTTRAFTLEVSVDNPAFKIKPGMIANVIFDSPNQLAINKITLPGEIILHEPDGTSYVYIVSAQEKKAHKRKIEVGTLINDNLDILSGLDGSELVVTGGQNKLHEGSAVSFKTPSN